MIIDLLKSALDLTIVITVILSEVFTVVSTVLIVIRPSALFFLLGVRGGDLRAMAYLELSGYSQRNERSPRVNTSLWRRT